MSHGMGFSPAFRLLGEQLSAVARSEGIEESILGDGCCLCHITIEVGQALRLF